MLRIMGLAIIAMSATGCATNQVSLQFRCDLQGAVIYQNGNSRLGECGTSAIYDVSEQDRAAGKIKTAPLTAVWPSGASSTVPAAVMDLSAGSRYFFFDFYRPRNLPNYDADARFDLEVKKLQVLQAQQRAQALQNLWQIYQTTNPPRRREVDCTSVLVGGVVHTNCY
jgi:hypothetical protein